jgi:hypothetical protein
MPVESLSHLANSDLVQFADTVVNLKRDDAKKYRDQVGRVEDKVNGFIKTHPDYGLVKMLRSGSLAKGTALSTLNDIDVAVYIQADKEPRGSEALVLDWLAQKLRDAYPMKDPDDIKPVRHVVRIHFRGTGLDVDVGPVHYDGAPDDKGFLIERHTGKRVLTSIPLHLKFIRVRKEKTPDHFAQVVRFVKWWTRERQKEDQQFRFKSFLAEMLCAHLMDIGRPMTPYAEALEGFFSFVAKSQLRPRIFFDDYYSASELPQSTTGIIEVFDPVNPNNNVAADYTDADRKRIIEASTTALEAIAAARYATTRTRALECWRRVLGPGFGR